MWIGSKCESSSAGQEALFNELTREVKTAAPCSQLTYRLRNQLERCDLSVRSELAPRVFEGCSPLFIACKKGNVEIVEYLLSVCNANVEVKGLYEVQDDQYDFTRHRCGPRCLVYDPNGNLVCRATNHQISEENT